MIRKKKKRIDALSILPDDIPPEVQTVPHETQMLAIKLSQKGLGDLQIINILTEKENVEYEVAAAAAVGVKIYLGKQFKNFIPALEVLKGIHMTDYLISECSKIHDFRGAKDVIKMRLDHVKALVSLLKG